MILTAGELLVEFVSHETGCGLAKNTTFSGPYPSGAPAIFADQAARVGARTAILGSVGADPFGDMLIQRLKDDGVDVSHVSRISDRSTGTAFVSYFHDGSRVFIFHLNATAADQIGVVPDLDQDTILHVSGASLGNSRIRAAIMTLVEIARSVGRISYDPNIRPELMKDSSIKSCISDIIDACDYLLPSEADLEALFPGTSPGDFVESMIGKGKSGVAVKRGEKGVIGSDGGQLISLPGMRVNEVDPTGAGDCFCGTLMGLLDQDHPFEDALRAANISGALHVSKRGPMEWNPTLGDIRKQMDLSGT